MCARSSAVRAVILLRISHAPDNNPVSSDTVVRAPFMTQWLAGPLFIPMPSITTIAGGRTFTAMGHIAHNRRDEPWLNTLYARNAYNGTKLWSRKLPDGYLAHRSAFIATGDTFYMIDINGNGCLLIDPETGVEKGRIHIPELTGEWKWIALKDGYLYAKTDYSFSGRIPILDVSGQKPEKCCGQTTIETSAS